MYDQERQSKAIEGLTKYLQYFKSYFSVTFSLIECHAFSQKFSHVQLQKATQKVANKKFQITFEQSPFGLYVNDKNKSYIDRFYMRIVQFLEFRLNIFKSPEADSKLASVLSDFIDNLHKIFKNLTVSSIKLQYKQRISVGQVFVSIQGLIKRLIQSIFDRLEQTHQKSIMILQEIKFSRKIITQHVLNPFHEALNQMHRDEQPDFSQCGEKGFNQNKNQIYNGQFGLSPGFRSKSDLKIENFHSVDSRSLRQSKMHNEFFSRKLQMNTSQISRKSVTNPTQKQSYSQLLSVMDIQDIEIYSRQYILEELKSKNTKNKQIINKYVKVYKKKERKHKDKVCEASEAEIYHENEKMGDSRKKKDFVLNFQTKSKSELNIVVALEKKIPLIKGGALFSHDSGQMGSIGSIMTTKLPTKYTTQNNNISEAMLLLQQKKGPKSKSQNIRHQLTKNAIINQNPQFQHNRETFAYKQKEKLYFQSLKNKLSLEYQKLTNNRQNMKREQDNQTSRKMNKISAPSIIQSTQSNNYRKLYGTNMKNNIVMKGSNFVINRTQEKIRPSRSDLFSKSKNEQTNFNDNPNHVVTLEGSRLHKRMPKRNKLIKFLENEDLINSTIAEDLNRSMDKKTKQSATYQSHAQPDPAVLVLPRISSIKKQLNPHK